MQTTQGPPPQYTLPVVQPHLAPPPGPNVKEGYQSYRVRRLAMAQIILGCLAFGFQLWDAVNLSVMGVIGAGLWSGVFFIFTGSLGLHSANQKTVCSIVSYMVMSIFSSFMAISLLVISSMNLDYYNSCNYHNYWHCEHMSGYMSTCTIFLSTMLIIISLVEGIMAVIAASFACHGCCCSSTNQRVLPYTYPVQYVQGPNGQLLLVTGQQPTMVTTTTGQQVLIAANPGSYQIAGLQGNYQTLGVPAPPPYMTTVPTMPTQQPMPQPNSVQPPAYQAVAAQATGNQQPQVHQSAANGKTNTAYVEN